MSSSFSTTLGRITERCVCELQKEKYMSMTRREMCLLLPAVLFPAVMRPEGMAAQDGSMPSAMYPFEKLPIRTPNNAQIRDVLKGKLATGESLEVHETTLLPGGAPHPPHHHVHSEMWLIREGTVELTVNGASYRLGPGSVGFVHSNDEHGIKNVGTTPATYFVVAVGPGAVS
jgi:mannose-6-phosphate isomerase-like protein (cupin superfamily)